MRLRWTSQNGRRVVDRRALEQTYRLHGASLYRRALRILGNTDDAREVLQEVFLDLLETPEQFSGGSALLTFFYSATTNRCLNRLRDSKNRCRLLDERGSDLAYGASSSAMSEHLFLARQLLAQMPLERAQTAVYFYFDEMTYDEIAMVMKCSRRHIANLLADLKSVPKEGL